MTSVEVTLDICKSRTKHAVDPDLVDDKVNKGRIVHVQTGYHHGRAMLIVRKAKPESFSGKLSLTAITDKVGRVRIFAEKDEVAAAGQAVVADPYEIPNASIKPPGVKLWVEGATVSNLVSDTGYRLGVSGVDPEGDRVVATVVQFSQLKALIPGTPPNPDRNAPPVTNHPVADQQYLRAGAGTAVHYSEDDTDNRALVLIEGSMAAGKSVALSVQIAPAGVPVRWSIQRDVRRGSGDHANVIALNPNAIPTLSTASGLATTMLLDAVGTFHIRPYVDCNGNNIFDHNDPPDAAHPAGQRIDREPFIIMNLILVRVQAGDNSASRADANHLTFTPAAPTAAGNFRVSSTDIAGDWSAANKAHMGCHNNATAIVTGGGPVGRNGLDRVYAGWVNNRLTSPGSTTMPPGPNIVAEYRETPPIPLAPIIHRRVEIWDGLSNSTGPVYLPPPPPPPLPLPAPPPVVPVIMGGPFLDTSHPTADGAGTGGNTCTGTEGDWGPPIPINQTNRAIGQTWRVEMWDSPGRTVSNRHEAFPGTAANPIPIIHAWLYWDFRSDLVFWTNVQGGAANAGATGDPADRLYATVITNHWDIRVDVTFDVGTGAGSIKTRTLSMTPDPSPNRLAAPCEGRAVQVRAPVSLEMNAVDART